MDGITPTIQPGSDDPMLSSTSVKVDLLHPSEIAPEPAVVDQKLPAPTPAAIALGAQPAPAPVPSVAPITPISEYAKEPTFEMVGPAKPDPKLAPPETKTVPMDDLVVPSTPGLGVPPNDPAPAPVAAAPFVPTPVPAKSHRGLIIGLIALIILIILGVGSYFLFFKKATSSTSAPTHRASVAVTAVTPSALSQESTDAAVAAGGTVASAPGFQMTAETTATSGTIAPQIEIEPIGTAFTGTPTTTGAEVTATGSNLTLSIGAAHLDDGSYHWQARTQVGTTTSPWVTFASDTASTTPDFIVKSTGPSAPTIGSITGGSVSGTMINATQNQPTFSGKTDTGTTLSLTVSPDAITVAPTVASDGSWTAAPSQTIANGSHSLVVTATDSAGNHSQATYTLDINQAAAVVPSNTTSGTTAQTTGKLAATGDTTDMMSLLGLLLAAAAGTGLILAGRRRTE